MIWNFEILNVSVYHIINYLIIYSFIGWLWESCYVSVCERRLVNRGFITGPLCTIYGWGAVSIYLVLKPLTGKWILLYFAGVALTTSLEYITAVVMEGLFHTSWWDYTEKKLNYKGRICLESSLFWGVATLLLFSVLQPFVDKIVALYSFEKGKIYVSIILIFYSIDYVFAVIAAMDVSKQLQKWDEVFDSFIAGIRNSKLYQSGEEIKYKMEELSFQLQRVNYFKLISKRVEVSQAFLIDRIENLNIPKPNMPKLDLPNVIDDIQDTFRDAILEIKNVKVNNRLMQRRILNAYPNIKSSARINKTRQIIYNARYLQKSSKQKIYKDTRNR